MKKFLIAGMCAVVLGCSTEKDNASNKDSWNKSQEKAYARFDKILENVPVTSKKLLKGESVKTEDYRDMVNNCSFADLPGYICRWDNVEETKYGVRLKKIRK